MILDTFHTAIMGYMLWDFAVDNFGKYEIYHALPWTYSSTPIFSKLRLLLVAANAELTS